MQALRQALKESPLEVTIHLEDDSSSPHQLVALNKGAVQWTEVLQLNDRS